MRINHLMIGRDHASLAFILSASASTYFTNAAEQTSLQTDEVVSSSRPQFKQVNGPALRWYMMDSDLMGRVVVGWSVDEFMAVSFLATLGCATPLHAVRTAPKPTPAAMVMGIGGDMRSSILHDEGVLRLEAIIDRLQ